MVLPNQFPGYGAAGLMGAPAGVCGNDSPRVYEELAIWLESP